MSRILCGILYDAMYSSCLRRLQLIASDAPTRAPATPAPIRGHVRSERTCDVIPKGSVLDSSGGLSRDKMKSYPLAEELLRPVLRVAMPRAARDPAGPPGAPWCAAFLARSLPPRGRGRILPMPPQVQALAG